MKRQILAADIGGTSSRFAHFELDRGASEPLSLKSSVWLKTAECPSFAAMLHELGKHPEFTLPLSKVGCAVFAAAGPITEGGMLCSPPNIKWEIDLREVQREFKLPQASVINDFLAQAYSACSPLAQKSLQILPGKPGVPGGTLAVVGAGTGLGKAIVVVQHDGKYLGVPSEGGHGSFAPETDQELEFHRFLRTIVRGKYPTWEDVVSGRGLSNIHHFLTKQKLEPREVADKFGEYPETLIWIARMYGRVCRNFALETLALGGVYIAGGVAVKNFGILDHPAFAEAFLDSQVHGEMLAAIPVALINDEQSGLWGSGYYASLLSS